MEFFIPAGEMIMRANIKAKIEFFETKDGGREGSTRKGSFGCIFVMDEVNNDCVLMLGDDVSVSPGQTVIVSVAFLAPDLVVPRLEPGKKFFLRELRSIAEGEVLEIFG